MAAALLIGPVFFRGSSPATQALSSFLTFAVAFSPDRWARRCSDISATPIAYCRQRRITVRFPQKPVPELLLMGATFAPIGALLPELFPPEIR